MATQRTAPVFGESPYVVTTDVTGPTYYLRTTIWTHCRDRADQFDTVEAARTAIERGRKFNPKAMRAARIIPAVEI